MLSKQALHTFEPGIGARDACCQANPSTQKRDDPELSGLSLKLMLQRLMQPVTHDIRHGEELSIAIEVNRLARCIKYHFAMRASADVLFDQPFYLDA